jgi:hypothetical protein
VFYVLACMAVMAILTVYWLWRQEWMYAAYNVLILYYMDGARRDLELRHRMLHDLYHATLVLGGMGKTLEGIRDECPDPTTVRALNELLTGQVKFECDHPECVAKRESQCATS